MRVGADKQAEDQFVSFQQHNLSASVCHLCLFLELQKVANIVLWVSFDCALMLLCIDPNSVKHRIILYFIVFYCILLHFIALHCRMFYTFLSQFFNLLVNWSEAQFITERYWSFAFKFNYRESCRGISSLIIACFSLP